MAKSKAKRTRVPKHILKLPDLEQSKSAVLNSLTSEDWIPSPAPHDLRRTCARLCHQAGGELEQIQFLLGDVSVQTTDRYLGCKQRFRNAVNDRIGLEPDASGSP
jgi:integrase